MISLLAGCAIGFLGANSLNRSELERLRTEAAGAQKPTQTGATGNAKLTDEEIQAGIHKADENSSDLVYQRNMGIALYRYASSNKDTVLLAESARLLKRVLASDPQNTDINIALGNTYFDIGYFNKDSASFAESRGYYETALAKKPDDAAVRTDYGLTFFLQEPVDNDRALMEFDKALRADPKNEKALEFATQIHVKRGDTEKARATLERLRIANPSNAALAGLSALTQNSPEPRP